MKVSRERGRGTVMMNGEIMMCLFTEWTKEKDEPETDSHPMTRTKVSPGPEA